MAVAVAALRSNSSMNYCSSLVCLHPHFCCCFLFLFLFFDYFSGDVHGIAASSDALRVTVVAAQAHTRFTAHHTLAGDDIEFIAPHALSVEVPTHSTFENSNQSNNIFCK